jgi:hypothetical protein
VTPSSPTRPWPATVASSCAPWCADKDDEIHQEQAVTCSSWSWHVLRSAERSAQSLSANLVQDRDFTGDVWPTVEVCIGDEPVLNLTPPQARSLAAGLVRLADLAEGVALEVHRG